MSAEEQLMASVTIKNMPDDLLERLRRKAAAAHRSVNQQILRLLEQALAAEPPDNRQLGAEIEAQVRAWEALAGKWSADEPAEEEVGRIYAARTAGRKVEL
jgi:plasmid stability protein